MFKDALSKYALNGSFSLMPNESPPTPINPKSNIRNPISQPLVLAFIPHGKSEIEHPKPSSKQKQNNPIHLNLIFVHSPKS
jgi:hypothetical protein